jgi:hypothetical protein
MLHTLIKIDNTVAALYNHNTTSAKSLKLITFNVMEISPSREAKRCSATQSILRLLQNMSVHYNFHHSLTHTLSPNFFSPPIFCSHIYSSLNNIMITGHMFSAPQTPCWTNKMGDKERKTLTNHLIPNLMYWSYTGTNNTWWSSNLKPHQPYPKYIY